MCTRFVFRGGDVITGFNFDIDLSVWDHAVVTEKDRFYIGIMRPDGMRHSYHGVNRNGNAGALLYVHGNAAGAYQSGGGCMTIAGLTEQFIRAQLSFDDALRIVKEKKIVYAPDATMQAMLCDIHGRTLVIEPGLRYREARGPYAPITNYSLINPKSIRPFIVPGGDRYERAARLLNGCGEAFCVSDAFALLRAVRQEGVWATRVSFVYSANEGSVYYVKNNRFDRISKCTF